MILVLKQNFEIHSGAAYMKMEKLQDSANYFNLDKI